MQYQVSSNAKKNRPALKLQQMLNAPIPTIPPEGQYDDTSEIWPTQASWHKMKEFYKQLLREMQITSRKHDPNECSVEDFACYFLNSIRQQTELFLRLQPATENTSTPKKANNKSTTKSKHSITSEEQQQKHHDDSQWSNSSSFLALNDSSFHNSTISSSSTPIQQRKKSVDGQGQSKRSSAGGGGSYYNTSGGSIHMPTTSFSLADFMRHSSQSSGGLSLVGSAAGIRSTNKSRRSLHQQQSATPKATSTLQSSSDNQRKKRVVPLTISPRVTDCDKAFGSSSSFSNENNILPFLAKHEIEDKNKCAILKARRELKMNAPEISKELQQSILSTIANDTNEDEKAVATSNGVDFQLVTYRAKLQRLSVIYALLMDMNLCYNVLNELAFVLTLVNINTMKKENLEKDTSPLFLKLPTDNGEALLMDNVGINAVYFALCLLRLQADLLSLLDPLTLRVVLEHERLLLYTPDLVESLVAIQQTKQELYELEKSKNAQLSTKQGASKPFKNVYYQADKDSRENFATQNEFGAFKSQRDLFYDTLKQWEKNHINPRWSFHENIKPKILQIFAYSENVINMAHFAKLFVSQLLICTSGSAMSDLDELDGFDNLQKDQEKVHKLLTRFYAPGVGSTDYQFPRHQAFFKNFINECQSMVFIEQLKMVLYLELLRLNNDKYEVWKLPDMEHEEQGKNTGKTSKIYYDDDEDIENVEAAGGNTDQQLLKTSKEFVIRPELLSSLMVLAKFLGYVVALPFNNNLTSSTNEKFSSNSNQGALPPNIENVQIQLRNSLQSSFEPSLCEVLRVAFNEGKLLITLPWLIQYLLMLDNITLQLNQYKEFLEFLYEIYKNVNAWRKQSRRPTSVFIIRSCIGNLLDAKPVLQQQYYNYRASSNEIRDMRASEGGDDRVTFSKSIEFLAVLEYTLRIACPFLDSFRVQVMPTKYAKALSRTGRFRYVTTRLDSSSQHNSSSFVKDTEKLSLNTTTPSRTKPLLDAKSLQQRALLEAFIGNQSPSMRHLIEFVSERVYKSEVRDAIYNILEPLKKEADNKVNAISSNYAMELLRKQVVEIYQMAFSKALDDWNRQLNKSLNERISQALDSLLPTQTPLVIKNTYRQIIDRKVQKQVANWRELHMYRSNYFCGDVQDAAQRLWKRNQRQASSSNNGVYMSEMKIINDKSTSSILDDLQYWLYVSSLRLDLLSESTPTRLKDYLCSITEVFDNNIPLIFDRIVMGGLIQLMQNLILHKPHWLNDEMAESFCLALDEFRERALANEDLLRCHLCQYKHLTNLVFIKKLNACAVRYDKLQVLLVVLLKHALLDFDFVSDMLLELMQHSWSEDVLSRLSKLSKGLLEGTKHLKTRRLLKRGQGDKRVANQDNDDDDAIEIVDDEESELKSRLMLDFMADFAQDLDLN